MPWNLVRYESERYRKDFDAVCALCQERDVAVQMIKSVARSPWATTEPNPNIWYQPFEDPADIEQAVHWVLVRSRTFFNTVDDLDLLPLALDASSRFEASPGDDAMRAVVEPRRATALFGSAT